MANLSSKQQNDYDELKTKLYNYKDSVDSVENEIKKHESDEISNTITPFSPSQVDMDVYLNSPCYEKIGFDPSNTNLKAEYEQCENKYYQNLYINIGIVILLLISAVFIFRIFVRKKKNSH